MEDEVYYTPPLFRHMAKHWLIYNACASSHINGISLKVIPKKDVLIHQSVSNLVTPLLKNAISMNVWNKMVS